MLGGALVDSASWRWVFFVNVPVAVVVAVLTPRFLPSPARRRAPFDLPGALLATAGLALAVFALSRAADHGWASVQTSAPLAAGVVALAVFVRQERRAAQPLMPLWVFADRDRGGAYLIQALMGAALFGMFFLSTLYLQNVQHYGALKAGAAFIPATVLMMAAAGAMSKVVNRVGVRYLVAVGTGTAAVGMLLLSALHSDSPYLTGVMFPMMVLTAGLGTTFVPVTLAAVSGVDGEQSGLVAGVSTTAIQVGGAIGLAVLATVATTSTRHAALGASLPNALTHGYTDAFRLAALIIAAAVPLALALLRLRPGDDSPAATELGRALPAPAPPATGSPAAGRAGVLAPVDPAAVGILERNVDDGQMRQRQPVRGRSGRRPRGWSYRGPPAPRAPVLVTVMSVSSSRTAT